MHAQELNNIQVSFYNWPIPYYMCASCLHHAMLDSLSRSNHTLFMQSQGTDCTVMSLTL